MLAMEGSGRMGGTARNPRPSRETPGVGRGNSGGAQPDAESLGVPGRDFELRTADFVGRARVVDPDAEGPGDPDVRISVPETFGRPKAQRAQGIQRTVQGTPLHPPQHGIRNWSGTGFLSPEPGFSKFIVFEDPHGLAGRLFDHDPLLGHAGVGRRGRRFHDLVPRQSLVLDTPRVQSGLVDENEVGGNAVQGFEGPRILCSSPAITFLKVALISLGMGRNFVSPFFNWSLRILVRTGSDGREGPGGQL